MSLFAELQRRNVIRVGLTYVISAWVFAQVFDLAVDAFEAPAWVLKVVITMLALGALPVLVFSWVYEMTPEGLRRDADLKPGESEGARTAGRLNWAVLVLLVVAIGLFGYQHFDSDEQDPQPVAAIETGPSAALGAKSQRRGRPQDGLLQVLDPIASGVAAQSAHTRGKSKHESVC